MHCSASPKASAYSRWKPSAGSPSGMQRATAAYSTCNGSTMGAAGKSVDNPRGTPASRTVRKRQQRDARSAPMHTS